MHLWEVCSSHRWFEGKMKIRNNWFWHRLFGNEHHLSVSSPVLSSVTGTNCVRKIKQSSTFLSNRNQLCYEKQAIQYFPQCWEPIVLGKSSSPVLSSVTGTNCVMKSKQSITFLSNGNQLCYEKQGIQYFPQ